jgi:3-oxoadipate enol-lactonase
MTTTERADSSMQPLFESLRDASIRAAAGGDKGVVFDLIVPSTFSAEWQASQAQSLGERRAAVATLPDPWFTSFAGLLESARGVDLRPLLARIVCPTLVVGADQDRMFPVKHSEALAAAIPGARLEIIHGGSHGLVVERPGEAAALVHRWVEEQR